LCVGSCRQRCGGVPVVWGGGVWAGGCIIVWGGAVGRRPVCGCRGGVVLVRALGSWFCAGAMIRLGVGGYVVGVCVVRVGVVWGFCWVWGWVVAVAWWGGSRLWCWGGGLSRVASGKGFCSGCELWGTCVGRVGGGEAGPRCCGGVGWVAGGLPSLGRARYRSRSWCAGWRWQDACLGVLGWGPCGIVVCGVLGQQRINEGGCGRGL